VIPPPRDPIARAIFDALDREQQKRPERSYPQWLEAEEYAVWQEVLRHAPAFVPRDRVAQAMRSASGHVDYPWKVAYYCAELCRTHSPKEDRT